VKINLNFSNVGASFIAYVFLFFVAQIGCSSQGELFDISSRAHEKPAGSGLIESGLVTRVIDGITIEVETNQGIKTISYLGLDLPLPDQRTAEGRNIEDEIYAFNSYLTEGKIVQLEADPLVEDKTDVVSMYVYVNGQFINRILLEKGYARLSTRPYEYSLIRDFAKFQEEAVKARRGMWTRTESLGDQSQATPSVNSQNVGKFAGGTLPSKNMLKMTVCEFTGTSGRLAIKGDISKIEGDRIYYVPSSVFYADVVIEETLGEVWFCTEQEAVSNGWKRASR